jgi:hypothetical protein
MRFIYLDKIVNIVLLLSCHDDLDEDELKPIKYLPYVEKCFEAFPSCFIACHFLYFEPPQD